MNAYTPRRSARLAFKPRVNYCEIVEVIETAPEPRRSARLAFKPRVNYCEIVDDIETAKEVREYTRNVSPAPEPRTRRQLKTKPDTMKTRQYTRDVSPAPEPRTRRQSRIRKRSRTRKQIFGSYSGCNCVKCRYGFA